MQSINQRGEKVAVGVHDGVEGLTTDQNVFTTVPNFLSFCKVALEDNPLPRPSNCECRAHPGRGEPSPGASLLRFNAHVLCRRVRVHHQGQQDLLQRQGASTERP